MQLIGGLCGVVKLNVVAPKLFPHARATLIENGIVKESNVLRVERKDDEVQRLRLGFYGNALQVVLNIRKESYKRKKRRSS